MRVLVLNSGSSSIKFQLLDTAQDPFVRILKGGVDKIGNPGCRIDYSYWIDGIFRAETVDTEGLDYGSLINEIFEIITVKTGLLNDIADIGVVGHRVVHGGEDFISPALVTEENIEKIESNNDLAPLHNPVNIQAIRAILKSFPEVPQVAVFDTAFHQSIPARAYRYAIPNEFYEKHKIRRYGFHGTSHKFVYNRAKKFLEGQSPVSAAISIHLGNGCSMAAIQNGKCIDTSMGFTPLEGLVMGTRSGDIDPSIIDHMHNASGISVEEVTQVLNKKSGLKALTGTNDMREVLQMKDTGDEAAILALDIYAYRIRKYIGSYWAAMGELDTILFTAGIGENNAWIREQVIEPLSNMGIKLSKQKNTQDLDQPVSEVNEADSPVKVLVVATDEEYQIAAESMAVLSSTQMMQ